MRGLLARAPRLWLSGGESWSSMFGSTMPWTDDQLGAGSLRLTSCLPTMLSPSGSTSGGNATQRRAARKRWSKRTGPSVLELPLLRGVFELLLYMAGPAINPVQVFRTLRDLHWEFLRLWTGFELPSSCHTLPCYATHLNRNILDFMRWPHIGLGAQDLNDIQRPKYFQQIAASKVFDKYYNSYLRK
jgi:hypothetical protein